MKKDLWRRNCLFVSILFVALVTGFAVIVIEGHVSIQDVIYYLNYQSGASANQNPAAIVQPTSTSTSQPPTATTGVVENNEPVGTVHPTLPLEVLFINSDCPTQTPKGALPALTPNGSHGALDCRYHAAGQYGPDNMEIRIYQYNDPVQFKQIMDSELGKLIPQAIASKKADYSPTDFNQLSNEGVDEIQNDASGIVYMITYNDGNSWKPANPLCGDGGGELSVEGKFVIELRLKSCNLSEFATDYSQVLTSMKDAALAAIQRAEANRP
jgi:hypothetical protein